MDANTTVVNALGELTVGQLGQAVGSFMQGVLVLLAVFVVLAGLSAMFSRPRF